MTANPSTVGAIFEFLDAVFGERPADSSWKIEWLPRESRPGGWYAGHGSPLSPDSIARTAERFGDKANLYLATTFHSRENKGPRAAGSATLAPAVWADIDYGANKVHKVRADAVNVIKRFALPPSAIVESGHGFHCWWRLREPSEPEDFSRHLAIVRGLGVALGGDDTADMARVLRIPGTYNLKNPASPLPVKLVRLNPDAAYNLSDLEEAGVEAIEKSTTNGHQRLDPEDLNGVPVGERDTTLFKWACKLRGADIPREMAEQIIADVAARCTPPFPEHDALEKVRRAYDRYQPRSDASASIATGAISLSDFRAYLPEHKFIFVPTRELWPAASVNAKLATILTGRIGKDGKPEYESASAWLDREQSVEQMTWAPGEPMDIRDRLISHGGWFRRQGVTTFNLYRPPEIEPGDADQADPWLMHVHHVYPDEAEHILDWLAHRVQRPGEKLNHALVLGGEQGVGKDTLLEPVKHAIGPWNFREVSPPNLMGRFNDYVKSVVLRVSEGRDLGDVDRYALYEHTKTLIAAPPDVHRCDEKYVNEYAVPNVTGVIFTTNNKTSGIYIAADDRRHFVAWSDCTKKDFTESYWNDLYRWYADGGNGHVTAYLQQRDISAFDPKAPPPRTAAWWEIVDANRAPENAEMTTSLEWLRWPAAVTVAQVAQAAEIDNADFSAWLRDRRNSRQIPHRFEEVGYTRIRNEGQRDGLWKIRGKYVAVFGRQELSLRDRIAAAREVTEPKRGGEGGEVGDSPSSPSPTSASSSSETHRAYTRVEEDQESPTSPTSPSSADPDGWADPSGINWDDDEEIEL